MKDRKLLNLEEYREKLFETARFIMATRAPYDMGMNDIIADESEQAARSLVDRFYTTYE